jgi:hypothetical protein
MSETSHAKFPFESKLQTPLLGRNIPMSSFPSPFHHVPNCQQNANMTSVFTKLKNEELEGDGENRWAHSQGFCNTSQILQLE